MIMKPYSSSTNDLGLVSTWSHVKLAGRDIFIAMIIVMAQILLASFHSFSSIQNFIIENVDSILLSTVFGPLMTYIIMLLTLDCESKKIVLKSKGVLTADLIIIFAYVIIFYLLITEVRGMVSEEQYRKEAENIVTSWVYWSSIFGLWMSAFFFDLHKRGIFAWEKERLQMERLHKEKLAAWEKER